MTDLMEAMEEPEENCAPTSYSDVGHLLIQVIMSTETYPTHKFADVEVFDYCGCVGLIEEAEGVRYLVEEACNITEDGFYVIEGITGKFIQGDGWTIYDYVSWHIGVERRATAEEIELQQVISTVDLLT